jgi:AbrB family looped-hinge helix DNA binding protein
MSKVTGKYQVTLPKRLAETHGIKVGDEIDFIDAGDHISVMPPRRKAATPLDPRERLVHFDRATERQRTRQRTSDLKATRDRNWTREDLYQRGRTG